MQIIYEIIICLQYNWCYFLYAQANCGKTKQM